MKFAKPSLLLVLSIASMSAWADHAEHDHSVREAPKSTVAPAFVALDKNKDGYLSKAEMAKHPMAAHFGMMDANKDGKLSPREFSSM